MAEKKQKAGYNAKVSDEKRQIVNGIKDDLTSAKGAVLTSYKGLTVAMDTELRRELRKAGVTYRVIKNTMTRIAAKEAGLDELAEHLEGTTALGFSKEDAIAPAKVICGFMKKNKLEDAGILTIKTGLVEGKVISDKEVKALADLPSREELIAKLLGSMNAPIANTVGVLSGVIRNFVYVLDAVREQKEKASA